MIPEELSTEVNEVADEVYTGRVIRNGLVAVLYSPGFGAGWSTWNQEYSDEELVFDPWIVDILLNDQFNKAEKVQRILTHCSLKYPDIYTGGVKDLIVEWIPQGSVFRIEEYDGSESLEFRETTHWFTA